MVALAGAVVMGISLAFVISNGSFYLLSNRFADMGWVEYAMRVATYFPPYALSTLMYVFCVAALHAVVVAIATPRAATTITPGGPK